VKSCETGKLEQLVNGKKTNVEGFEVELDDTVLFPEGGGQVYFYFKIFILTCLENSSALVI
jgi:hypothetical protein